MCWGEKRCEKGVKGRCIRERCVVKLKRVKRMIKGVFDDKRRCFKGAAGRMC